MLVGYARTSTTDQIAGLEEQERLLLATGCNVEKLFKEHISAANADRPQLTAALDFVREGDVLICTKIDRLARSTADLLTTVEMLEKKGVGLRVLDFGGSEVSTKSPTGKMLLTMFGAIAEFERSLMKSRQLCGIARAKALGRYKGRQPLPQGKVAAVKALRAAGKGASVIASEVGISRASVYRCISGQR
ncbi:recombinase family protein [Rhizorhabdus argentea]|uniref:recombinase family protein n=1 Tax=Rhizorhabdus argentea TaxID=1387174 RepID=UPI0030ED64B9